MKTLFAVVGVLIIAITLIGAVSEMVECEAKGGKRLRGAWSSYECYDASSLKVLP